EDCSCAVFRSMSPVARCGMFRYFRSRSDWVPLPAPGGPINTSRIVSSGLLESAVEILGLAAILSPEMREVGRKRAPHEGGPAERRNVKLFEQPLVVPHHQMRVDLLNKVERDADRDQETSATIKAGDHEINS